MYKNIDFTKNGGFPVTQDTLAFMQEGYNETIAAITSTFGQYVILSGVTDLGSTYSDGWIIYNGELVKFVGGIKTARVAIEETATDETFGDDSVNTVYYTRVAKCVTIGGVLFSELKRFLLVDYASNFVESGFGISNVFSEVITETNTGTIWGSISAKAQKNNSSVFINASFDISQTSGNLISRDKTIEFSMADKYKFVVDSDFELYFPVNARIVNNTNLTYIRSENLEGTIAADGIKTIIRIYSPQLNANERAEISFNFMGQALNTIY